MAAPCNCSFTDLQTYAPMLDLLPLTTRLDEMCLLGQAMQPQAKASAAWSMERPVALNNFDSVKPFSLQHTSMLALYNCGRLNPSKSAM